MELMRLPLSVAGLSPDQQVLVVVAHTATVNK